MDNYRRVEADETTGAVTVRILRTEDGGHEAIVLPLADDNDDAHREGAYIVLSALGQTFPVPDALRHAIGIVRANPHLREVVVQIHEDAEWNSAWGALV